MSAASCFVRAHSWADQDAKSGKRPIKGMADIIDHLLGTVRADIRGDVQPGVPHLGIIFYFISYKHEK
jgi:hypothetical protein